MTTVNYAAESSNIYVQKDLRTELLAQDAERVGKYGFAKLIPQKLLPGKDILPINYLLSTNNRSNYCSIVSFRTGNLIDSSTIIRSTSR